MSEAVLDSSAVLALLLGEPGAEKIRDVLPGALLSTVNLAEVISKLAERGMPITEAMQAIEAIGVEIVAFDADQACGVGALRRATRAMGLSLGDRACIALGRTRGLSILTADGAWASLNDPKIVTIR